MFLRLYIQCQFCDYDDIPELAWEDPVPRSLA